jgi:hypothetical protein
MLVIVKPLPLFIKIIAKNYNTYSCNEENGRISIFFSKKSLFVLLFLIVDARLRYFFQFYFLILDNTIKICIAKGRDLRAKLILFSTFFKFIKTNSCYKLGLGNFLISSNLFSQGVSFFLFISVYGALFLKFMKTTFFILCLFSKSKIRYQMKESL